jgi:lysophospholipase L1-like esterase
VGCLAAVLFLAACSSAAKHAAAPSKTIFVAALGDSITAGSPGWDPSRTDAKLLGFARKQTSQWEYWAQQKDPRLQFRNCGIFGQRTDQIARRLVACQRGADVLVVQGGINDLAQGFPPAFAARNLDAMVKRGKSLGVKVEIADVPPWNNGYPDFAPKILELNRLIHRLAQADHVRVLPFYATLVDPQHPGLMKQAWTADGDHPSVEGYRRLGELAFRLP